MTDFTETDRFTALIEWCRTHPVRICVLFGSQATGRARPDSDVDLALWPDGEVEALTKLKWWGELEDVTRNDVSLVLVTADLDPTLGFEIARRGKLVFEVTPDLWPHHRAQLWHAFQDSLPFRRAEREQLRRFAEEIRRGA